MRLDKIKMSVSLLVFTVSLSSCYYKKVDPWDKMTEVYEQIVPPTFPDKNYVITDYYDGKDSLYTKAINQAITECSVQGGEKSLFLKEYIRQLPSD